MHSDEFCRMKFSIAWKWAALKLLSWSTCLCADGGGEVRTRQSSTPCAMPATYWLVLFFQDLSKETVALHCPWVGIKWIRHSLALWSYRLHCTQFKLLRFVPLTLEWVGVVPKYFSEMCSYLLESLIKINNSLQTRHLRLFASGFFFWWWITREALWLLKEPRFLFAWVESHIECINTQRYSKKGVDHKQLYKRQRRATHGTASTFHLCQGTQLPSEHLCAEEAAEYWL